MPIRQLEPGVAAKIAAGEVVERPASVVKELIENSIDAGATSIHVDLMNGGLQLIRVSDNGCGIPAGELPLALARHATSKVAQIEDLERIRSLGFRGEALASIAAVADVIVLSHHGDADQGAQISASNGQISEVSTAACPRGTIITVRNLFSSVPARLKFLKSRHTEVSHSHHLLEQYALAYPEIRFSVFSEGKQIFATAGDRGGGADTAALQAGYQEPPMRSLHGVLIEVYGLQVAEQMVSISSSPMYRGGDGQDGDPERPVVSGYISRPACYKNTRQYISFFVNRRWVHSRMLTYALEEAYHSLLLSGRHPIAVVNISLDPALLDVNVHPAKTEIRFLKERRVYTAVQRAVRNALLEEATMPEWSGKPTHIAGVVSPEGEESQRRSAPLYSGIPHDNPWLTVTEEETGSRPPMLARLWQSHVRGLEAVETGAASPGREEELAWQPQGLSATAQVSTPLDATLDPTRPPDVRQDQSSEPVPDGSGQNRAKPRLPLLRVLGQLAQSYIISEGPDGMYLIDQHAAHERILLERMLAALQARTPISQLLLTPIRLELAPTELGAIEDHMQQLEHIGFSLEVVDDEHVLLAHAVPNVLVKQVSTRSLYELLAELTAPEHLGHAETWEEHALANVACKAAIKANYFLTVHEMREMIEQLERTNAPYSCCHGRPTMVHFSLSALEREFGRR